MSLRRRFFYSIEGFTPPTKERTIQLGSYGFNVYLDRELAKRAFQCPLPEKSPIIDIGRGIIRGYGFKIPDYFQPYNFVSDEQNKLTSFIQIFNVPGDACDLDVDYRELEELQKEDNEYTKHWVEYCPHNVDNLQQASALLSLFTFWANTMEAVLNLRHPQEQP